MYIFYASKYVLDIGFFDLIIKFLTHKITDWMVGEWWKVIESTYIVSNICTRK